MSTEEYSLLLKQLKNKEIAEIVVEREDFAAFRQAWLPFEDRMHFVGEAGLNGKIIYHYELEAK